MKHKFEFKNTGASYYQLSVSPSLTGCEENQHELVLAKWRTIFWYSFFHPFTSLYIPATVTCAYCACWLRRRCKGCPIHELTERRGCKGTPHQEITARPRARLIDIFREWMFLRALPKKLKRKREREN